MSSPRAKGLMLSHTQRGLGFETNREISGHEPEHRSTAVHQTVLLALPEQHSDVNEMTT